MNNLLKEMTELGSSDLHIIKDSKARVRTEGRLVELNTNYYTKDEIINLVKELINDIEYSKFIEDKEYDCAIDRDFGRFRINLYFANNSPAIAIREIPTEPLSLEQLKSPEILKEIIKREKGLILVTGPTGSGKSTTLAAMLNEINITEDKHIITIEDPVEFKHKHKKSIFSQREVGLDTKSFANAIKYSLREDPDVILIGEMRDKETISAALTAAETGHLVFGTLHTNSASSTINRIIDVFPGEDQGQIKTQLASTLLSIISQTLIPKKEDGKRIAVQEILINTPAIGNLIRTDKTHQINSAIQTGSNLGMRIQNKVLEDLVKDEIIDIKEALKFSNNKEELKDLKEEYN